MFGTNEVFADQKIELLHTSFILFEKFVDQTLVVRQLEKLFQEYHSHVSTPFNPKTHCKCFGSSLKTLDGPLNILVNVFHLFLFLFLQIF